MGCWVNTNTYVAVFLCVRCKFFYGGPLNIRWRSFNLRKEVRFVSLASILTALSIGLDLLVKNVIPTIDFGLPYYAIPLIIGSIVLGPVYGAIMGFTSDLIGFVLAQRGSYAFLFAFSAIAWGVIPGLLLKKDSKWLKVTIAIILTHLIATGLNTLALWLEVSPTYATSNLLTRLIMIPINVVILSYVTVVLNQRLMPVYDDFLLEKS